MGSTSSKEKLMTKAIENQDINAIKILINDLKREEICILCKSLVPGDKNQCTILHYAIWQDNLELSELLLDYADDLEIRDGLGWTPLLTAVNRGSKENIKILLKRGAKIDCDSMKGIDLIATAMYFKDIELVQILIDHGAQVAISSDMHCNDENSTECHLLHFAADDGLTDIARLLISTGKIPINTLNQIGWSPLHLAAGRNHLDMVKLLLENGAEINIKDHDGNTPLAWAKKGNAKEVVNELERHGGIEDKEWHGEKFELCDYNLQTEKYQGLHGIDNSQFEIEDSIEKDSNILDALQRQH